MNKKRIKEGSEFIRKLTAFFIFVFLSQTVSNSKELRDGFLHIYAFIIHKLSFLSEHMRNELLSRKG